MKNYIYLCNIQNSVSFLVIIKKRSKHDSKITLQDGAPHKSIYLNILTGRNIVKFFHPQWF
jgi:hypothetical protein